MKYFLSPLSELRFEVDTLVTLILHNGDCEHLGMELLVDKHYNFKDTDSFIFTYYGCTVEIIGQPKIVYQSNRSNVVELFDTLDRMVIKKSNGGIKDSDELLDVKSNLFGRGYSSKGECKGTRIFITGNGRSSAITTLSNYLIRLHKRVRIVELDLETGYLVFPGVLGSIVPDSLIDSRKSKNLSSPYFFYYGDIRVNNEENYFRMVEMLLGEVREDVELVLLPRKKDLIEKIMSKFGTGETSDVQEGISEEKTDQMISLENSTLLVLGDERLFNYINISNKQLIGSGGYFPSKRSSDKKISEYFNGKEGELTSYTVRMDSTCVQIGEEHIAPESALPLGAKRKVDLNEVKEVEMEEGIILGISEAVEKDEVKDKPVIGFVYVQNKEAKKFLCTKGKVPKVKYLIKGSIKYAG